MRRVAIMAIGVSVVGATVAAAASSSVISQKGRIFSPGDISIGLGETIRVDNDDDVLHHVYVESPGFNFDSGEQPPGKQVAIRFTERGTFEVQCEIHPKMRLRVHVR